MAWMVRIVSAAAAAALAGCVSGAPRGDAVPMTQSEVDGALRDARDPRTFFLTVYQDEDANPVFVGGNRQNLDRVASLDFAPIGEKPLPVVEVRAGDAERACWALTDTTSPASWTGLQGARRLGLVPLGNPVYMATPYHVVDEVPGYLCVLPSLALEGGLRVDNALFYARSAKGPLWPLSRDPGAARVRFVLGMDILRSFSYVQWDFPSRRLVLSSVRPYRPDPRSVLALVPLETSTGALTVRGVVAGREQTVLIDLAGDYDLAVEKPPLGLVRQVSVGDLVLRQLRSVPTREMGFGFREHARLGLGVLARYRVTVDNRSNTLCVEAPAAP